MIPHGASSILEVGCGDGRVSNQFNKEIDSTGIDIDPRRIKSFLGNKLVGDISKLPVKNDKFDLVLACEVLEHLDNNSLHLTIEEMLRVSRKYILVTVPYKESLSANWKRCIKCGHIYNSWGHLRRFNLRILRKHFNKCKLVKARFLEQKQTYVPAKVYEIIKRLGNVWMSSGDENSSCPKCGGEPLMSRGNIFGKIFIRLLWRFERYSPWKRHIWIGCLLEK